MIRDMTFAGGKIFKTLLLVTPKDYNRLKLEEVFVRPFAKMGGDPSTVIAICLSMPKGRVTAAQARKFLEELAPAVKSLGIEQILCTQGQYFKILAKVAKVTNTHGRAFDTDWDIPVFYSPSAAQVYFDPKISQQIEMSLRALLNHAEGKDTGIIDQEDLEKRVTILDEYSELKDLLDKAKKSPLTFIDIETSGLMLGEHVLTISFSFSKDKAYAFVCNNPQRREALEEFFREREGKIVFHNAPFDVKHLIYWIFMDSPSDYEGMLEGLHIFFRDLEDTKILAYLALNNTAKAELSLKNLSYEYTGDYASDISFEAGYHDAVDYKDLLVYNGIDVIATAYVYDKFRTTVRNDQEKVYQDVFLPSLKTITQMELTGLPLNFNTVLKIERELNVIQQDAVLRITQHPETEKAIRRIREQEAIKATAKLKQLVKTADDFIHLQFNPKSGNHLRVLLYEVMGLEIKKTTQTGLASTGGPALEQMKTLMQHTGDPRLELIDAILDLQQVAIINSTFIPAFKDKSMWKHDGWRYLLGNFNLGGTVSGRLSSSKPNLQNTPSTGTKYATPIKECIQAPPGWIVVGADYFSLEDRISALQTKDPNKLKVYTDGYDGHCLRAYSYFKDDMPDITKELEEADEDDHVAIINSIEYRYKELRQRSKGPTFALTYLGTSKTLVENFGLTLAEAKKIETEYHKLYAVSEQWVTDQMVLAQQNGYVELAFGLRLRTPSLPLCIDVTDRKKLPYEAYSELKTAANALGQSYGLLNSYSANQFMERVWSSKYATSILPIAQIHDSQYYMIRNNLGCLKFVNDNLVECMEWCELPAIKHPEVGLGSSLEIFWPTWANPISLPNKASLKQLKDIIKQSLNRRKK